MSNKFSEYKRNSILFEIDLLVKTVETKLLPLFNESELEKEALIMSLDYDDAISQMTSYFEMRNDVLNLSAVWLYHLFEKDSNSIFSDAKWKERKKKLRAIDISLDDGSKYFIIDTILQDICNIHKHGKDSDAQKRLLKIKEDLFDVTKVREFVSGKTILRYKLKHFTLDDLKYYAGVMKLFWIEVYEKLIEKNSKSYLCKNKGGDVR